MTGNVKVISCYFVSRSQSVDAGVQTSDLNNRQDVSIILANHGILFPSFCLQNIYLVFCLMIVFHYRHYAFVISVGQMVAKKKEELVSLISILLNVYYIKVLKSSKGCPAKKA